MDKVYTRYKQRSYNNFSWYKHVGRHEQRGANTMI